MSREELIHLLVEARREQNISQAEVARRIGSQRSNVCRLETGKHNVTVDMILKIADALGKNIVFSLEDKAGEEE